MRVAVAGGGLAGLAAALELTKQGHAVRLVEARPTLGGAVQTLPEREGDPSPPPDNGQHVALGCCTAYLDFMAEIGRSADLRRVRLGLPVAAEDGRVATIRPGLVGLLRYAGGELAGGVFEGACGPLALERILALRSGAVELEVLSPETASPPAPAQPALAEQPQRQASAAPSTAQMQPRRQVEATSAFVEPPAPRSWLWALAPGLALALWLAIELAGRLSPRQAPEHGPGAPAAESVERRPPGVAR